MGTEIHGLDPPRKTQKLVPHTILAIHSTFIEYMYVSFKTSNYIILMK